jgi:hypothetical protein
VMGNIYLIVIFLLISFTSISATANNTWANCNEIAMKFTSSGNVTCNGFQNTTCPGNFSNGTCTFTHRISAICLNATPVRISIESNGLPKFCSNLNNSYPFHEQYINFTVNFNPDVSVNQLTYNPTTQNDLNAIVCNTNSTKSAPSSASFTPSTNFTNADRIVGISIDGVPIFNALNRINEDIFYPITANSTESVDSCLGHTRTNGTYYYRLGSSCSLDPPSNPTTTCDAIQACNESIANYSISMFKNHTSLTVIGIAKDGHIIYGPYTSNGKLVTTGFDICNGMFFDSIGNYGYFVTGSFPYVIGCYGPGNYPTNILPSCTENPPMNYTKSIYAGQFTTITSDTSLVSFNFVFLSMTIITIINKYY